MRVAVVEICRPEGVVMRCAWAVKARTSAKFTLWRNSFALTQAAALVQAGPSTISFGSSTTDCLRQDDERAH